MTTVLHVSTGFTYTFIPSWTGGTYSHLQGLYHLDTVPISATLSPISDKIGAMKILSVREIAKFTRYKPDIYFQGRVHQI